MGAKKKKTSSTAKHSAHQASSPAAGRSARVDSSGVIATSNPAPWPLIRTLLLIATGLATYLAWSSLTGSTVAGCGPESGCHKVLNSRWAYWFGLPVSILAVLTYLALLAGTFRLAKPASPTAHLGTWAWVLPAATLVLGAALWFVLVQVAIIKTLCPWCLTTHACAVLASALLVRAAPGFRRATAVAGTESVGSARPVGSLLLGLGGLVAMIVGQLAYSPKTFEQASIQMASLSNAPAASPIPAASPSLVTNAPTPPNPAPAPAVTPATPATTATPPTPERRFGVYNGAIQFNLFAIPLLGSPTAPRVIVSLFDYTCHHCRLMHPRLTGVLRARSNQLAIVNLPMPLDPRCNPTMTRTHPDHVQACDYAKIGLAVWKVRPEAMATYDDWVFEPDRPPALEEARNYARQLVGAKAFDEALADPWVERQLQMDVAIYDIAYRAGRGSMPQLLIGTNTYMGTLREEDLGRALREQLGLF